MKILFHLAFLLLFLSVGYSQTNECQEFKREFEGRDRFIAVYGEIWSHCNDTAIFTNKNPNRVIDLRTSKFQNSIKFENSIFEQLKISESIIQSKLILENITFERTSYISNSQIASLSLSNLKGTSLNIINSKISSLDISVEPNNTEPTKITITNSDIERLEITINSYYETPPNLILANTKLNKIQLKASAIHNNGIDFSSCRFDPELEFIDYHDLNKDQNDLIKADILLSIAQQYKTHGDYQNYLNFKARWKDQINRQNPSLVYGFNKVKDKYLGGNYFTELFPIIISLFAITISFSLIYFVLGFWFRIGQVFKSNATGIFEDPNNPEYFIKYNDKHYSGKNYQKKNIAFPKIGKELRKQKCRIENKKRGIYKIFKFYKDCLLFTINHFFSLRSDKVFNLTYFFSGESKIYVSKGSISKLLTFTQYIIGLWFFYSILMYLYNHFQSS